MSFIAGFKGKRTTARMLDPNSVLILQMPDELPEVFVKMVQCLARHDARLAFSRRQVDIPKKRRKRVLIPPSPT